MNANNVISHKKKMYIVVFKKFADQIVVTDSLEKARAKAVELFRENYGWGLHPDYETLMDLQYDEEFTGKNGPFTTDIWETEGLDHPARCVE